MESTSPQIEKSEATPIPEVELTSFRDLPGQIDQIIAWTKKHPIQDRIYHFPAPPKTGWRLRETGDLRHLDQCVAGSAALFSLYAIIMPIFQLNWKPRDVDLFILGQDKPSRMVQVGIDVNGVCQQTVEELLLNFDLPICRAAYNLAGDYWVSAQCLAAIQTHRQDLPLYLKDEQSFSSILEQHGQFEHGPFLLKMYYQRFCDRVKKYQQRGFGVNWIETDTIIPWVISGCDYARVMFEI